MGIPFQISQISSKPELTNMLFNIKNPINPLGSDMAMTSLKSGKNQYQIFRDINTNLSILNDRNVFIGILNRTNVYSQPIIFFFDLGDPESFNRIVKIIQFIRSLRPYSEGEGRIFYLVGIINKKEKVDESKMNTSPIREFADELKLTYTTVLASKAEDFNDLYLNILREETVGN